MTINPYTNYNKYGQQTSINIAFFSRLVSFSFFRLSDDDTCFGKTPTLRTISTSQNYLTLLSTDLTFVERNINTVFFRKV